MLDGISRIRWVRSALVVPLVALACAFGVMSALVGCGSTSSTEQLSLESGPAASHQAGVIYRIGRELYIDGRRYQFVGYNNPWMNGCGLSNWVINGAAMEKFFSQLRPNAVVRIFAFERDPLAGIDQIMTMAQRHHVRIVPVLVNGVEGCGQHVKDDAWFRAGYKEDLLPWVSKIVPRYRKSEALAYWEIINEPATHNGNLLRSFFDVVGGRIKTLDSAHLISSGMSAPYFSGDKEGRQWQIASASSAIDITSIHVYDKTDSCSPWAYPAASRSSALDKPLVIGEFDPLPDVDYRSAQQLQTRVHLAQGELDCSLGQLGISGALFWSYDGRVQRAMNGSGDPIIGFLRHYVLPDDQVGAN